MVTSYTKRAKNSASYTKRAKNILQLFRIVFISDSGDTYLVGQNEDKTLITQEQDSGYTNRVKN